VYGASDGLKTVVVERGAVGGQAGSSSCIENYLGFYKGISGADLVEQAREQACKFGAEILLARKGVRGQFTAGKGTGYLEDGTKIIARATPTAALGLDGSATFTPAFKAVKGHKYNVVAVGNEPNGHTETRTTYVVTAG